MDKCYAKKQEGKVGSGWTSLNTDSPGKHEISYAPCNIPRLLA